MKPTTFLIFLLGFFCFFLHTSINAQVCTGSLGDPVVNIDFGRGSNPGPPLTATSSTYTFTSSTCPDDGVYTIVNSTLACFDNSWHSILEDHTPNDTQGYMMLVNASFNPGDFYVDTVNNLCGNTSYEFAAWILNVLQPGKCNPNPILPALIFNIETIDGTVLGSYSTKGISSAMNPTWTQYGLFFKTPDNTTNVVIRLTNTAPGGCGNDIALDDITFRPCGPNVTVTADNGETNYDLCVGTTRRLNLSAKVSAGYNAPAFQWQQSIDTGLTWTDIAGASSTTYQVWHPNMGIFKYRLMIADGSNITIKDCRVASNIVTITTHDMPVVSAANDGPVCEEDVITLGATGGTSYQWIGPGNFTSLLSEPAFTSQIELQGIYKVTATDQFGCIDSASTIVVIKPRPEVKVSSNTNICSGKSVTLSASGGQVYTWFPAIGLSGISGESVTASPRDSTTYNVIVSNNEGCADTAKVQVNVQKQPIANAGNDKALLKGRSVTLNGEILGADFTYYWSPSSFLDSRLLLNATSTPTSEITYTLHAISNLGCGESSDEVVVKVFNDIYIPSAFSPNNDGLNDTWRIQALVAFPDAKVNVYNRYGHLVFEGSSNKTEWNGSFKNTSLPPGAYTYLVDLKNDQPVLKGMIMLIR